MKNTKKKMFHDLIENAYSEKLFESRSNKQKRRKEREIVNKIVEIAGQQ